ncbi:uncharacterized protein MONBRDRAFT_12356 [Monosiga brevicollis MX1]|uniref:Trehalase n=1 Tax=Monosiga brevicollis TaxID=81824 RepID=A9VC09_MONBE|nr:uncharacterized protein MONBRDRAFT_12356 [Monosiga brevicollis MX1]EDQ84943.1 predicted protein [Monosiga brevicollis MX1]|eukprot:XP_001750284.1 hypothetical protein [Monosiga brevicollis MX1]
MATEAEERRVEARALIQQDAEEVEDAVHETHLHQLRHRQSLLKRGPLLNAVQMNGLYNDSKTFVDRPLLREYVTLDRLARNPYRLALVCSGFEQPKLARVHIALIGWCSPEDVLKAFQELGDGYSMAELKQFVDDNFDQAGIDLLPHSPADWPETLPFYGQIRDAKLANWASGVHAIWNKLGRKTDPSINATQERHTLLALPYPFIVPGGRFREQYYWDTYFILRGLVLSGMYQSAQNVVRNFLTVLQQFGFVPNGMRVYYHTRSQPPLLTPMVMLLDEANPDTDFLRLAAPLLAMERDFWTLPACSTLSTVAACSNYSHTVSVSGASGQTHFLTRYFANTTLPRPESYLEDVNLAQNASDKATREQLYRDVATGAETGWDFSSRWFADPMRMETIRTSHVVPADLNAIMVIVDRHLATIADRAWAPVQLMLIEGLDRVNTPFAKSLATTLACRWLRSNYQGWVSSTAMFEKYNAFHPGQSGSGGEYVPQAAIKANRRRKKAAKLEGAKQRAKERANLAASAALTPSPAAASHLSRLDASDTSASDDAEAPGPSTMLDFGLLIDQAQRSKALEQSGKKTSSQRGITGGKKRPGANGNPANQQSPLGARVNQLDATAPTRRRGKVCLCLNVLLQLRASTALIGHAPQERAVRKEKKPSQMRQLMKEEQTARRRAHDENVTGASSSGSIMPESRAQIPADPPSSPSPEGEGKSHSSEPSTVKGVDDPEALSSLTAAVSTSLTLDESKSEPPQRKLTSPTSARTMPALESNFFPNRAPRLFSNNFRECVSALLCKRVCSHHGRCLSCLRIALWFGFFSSLNPLQTRYCDHALDPEVDETVKQLLKDSMRFYNRAVEKNPMNAKARRRLVLGANECHRKLALGKVKLLLVAPDQQRTNVPGLFVRAVHACRVVVQLSFIIFSFRA